MNQKPRIKIIKRAERERQSEKLTAKPPASVSLVAQVKALDAAATITEWVSKWQQQKAQSDISAFLTLSNARMFSKEAAQIRSASKETSPNGFVPELSIRKAARDD